MLQIINFWAVVGIFVTATFGMYGDIAQNCQAIMLILGG